MLNPYTSCTRREHEHILISLSFIDLCHIPLSVVSLEDVTQVVTEGEEKQWHQMNKSYVLIVSVNLAQLELWFSETIFSPVFSKAYKLFFFFFFLEGKDEATANRFWETKQNHGFLKKKKKHQTYALQKNIRHALLIPPKNGFCHFCWRGSTIRMAGHRKQQKQIFLALLSLLETYSLTEYVFQR